MNVEELASYGWSGIYAAAMAAMGAIGSVWLGKRIDGRRQREHDDGAARIQERADIRLAYQGIIDRLTAEQEKLWKMFREMQDTLADCERMHREDALKIGALEQQNQAQALEIAALERQNQGQSIQLTRLEEHQKNNGSR